ncbi:hypothetical protein AT302_19915 [Pandoraea norimbergensis]|uniref:Uncharacterized protein n=1 Tax=Pandoraea norimbergensis TaxID=93219 RepID=A0ABN4JMS3_9BURK|nr:hypothetical protein AT302_19915 [Pandoraea norimbergensis]
MYRTRRCDAAFAGARNGVGRDRGISATGRRCGCGIFSVGVLHTFGRICTRDDNDAIDLIDSLCRSGRAGRCPRRCAEACHAGDTDDANCPRRASGSPGRYVAGSALGQHGAARGQ